jgi:hypothetical protein
VNCRRGRRVGVSGIGLDIVSLTGKMSTKTDQAQTGDVGGIVGPCLRHHLPFDLAKIIDLIVVDIIGEHRGNVGTPTIGRPEGNARPHAWWPRCPLSLHTLTGACGRTRRAGPRKPRRYRSAFYSTMRRACVAGREGGALVGK